MNSTPTKVVRRHCYHDVWKRARLLANLIFEASKNFPKEETYSLTDQVRRSSRSVTANIAEAWQKRRYEAAFVNKLTDSAAEAAETQDWLIHAADCGYISKKECSDLVKKYEELLKTLHAMMLYAAQWCKPVSNHKPQTTSHMQARSE